MNVTRPPRKEGFIARVWWSSLPLRVVASTLAASMLVLLLGGFLLQKQATDGILAAKRESSIATAQTALDSARVALGESAVSADRLDERLRVVATESVARAGVSKQYDVVVPLRIARVQSSGLDASSIPIDLRTAMTELDKLYIVPTLVTYNDGRPSAPGIVIGALLEATPGGERVPFYFVFAEQSEISMLQSLQQAVVTTGALLIIALGAIAYVVARTIGRPIRQAARSAHQIAGGNLDVRLPVRGTDDLATLGVSMNDMAAELDKQITSYEELSRVQQQFVSDVSHELRTPLTTVRMAAELLYDGRDDFDPINARTTELLHDQLDRFEGLLSDLLEISRFDAGAAVLAMETHSLVEIVQNEVEAQRPLAESKDTPITVTTRGRNFSCPMDARRIQRVLRNLITNAIEHGESKPITITIAENSQALAVTVRDRGVGFEASQSTQVFGRFWRADPSRARTVGGTGLGLAIALEDVNLHGGWLNAWGRPGRGAQFRLTLPREGVTLTSSPLSLAPQDGRTP